MKSVYREVPYKVFNFCHRQGTILMAKKIKQLVHGGVLIPKYEPKGFKILYKGERLTLEPEVEEMAVAWVKKLGTDYVKEDRKSVV